MSFSARCAEAYNLRFNFTLYYHTPMQKPPLLLRITNIYFLLLGIGIAMPTLMFKYFSFLEILALILCALPIVVQKAWMRVICGVLGAVAGVVIFFALVSDFIDYISGKMMSHPWAFFSIGFLLAFSLMFFGGTLIYYGIRTNEAIEAT